MYIDRILYILYRTISTIMRKLLGSTKVSTDNKVTIVKKASEILVIKKGDLIAFYEEEGKIYIKKG